MAKRSLRNRSQRQKLVTEFRNGSIERQAFCKLHGMMPSTLISWLREFEEKSAFVPVRIEPSKIAPREKVYACGAAARIVGVSGATLEFTSGADAAWVAEICGRIL